jgi:hypothetical protein
MCGITGFLTSFTKNECEMKLVVKHMADRLVHRGPDDSGVWVDREAGVALGHRRLSILDLSPEGHQPMHSESGRYVIVFNGEVYNFEELRATLIFPMTDISMAAVLKHRNEFQKFQLPFVEFLTFEAVSDKWNLLVVAQRLNITVPQTHYISDSRSLERVYPILKFPMVLKPYRLMIWTNGHCTAASVKYAESLLLYQLATGKTVDTVDGYATGVRSRWLLGDLAWLWKVLARNELPPSPRFPKRTRSIFQFLNSFDSHTRCEESRWHDMKPFLFELARFVRR